jgi:hypothetical protein
MERRAAFVLAVGLSCCVAGLALSRGHPRLTLTNEGLVVAHAWRYGAWGLFAAVGAGASAAAVRRRPWVAGLLALLAFGAAARGTELLTHRIDVDREGVASVGMLSGERVAWSEVSRIERGPARLVVWGREDARIQVDTDAMSDGQRAILERSIARRVVERKPGSGVR